MNRRTKYNNRKVTLYGITFDSQAEANRYLLLRELQERGEIEDLRVHTRWQLVDDFTDGDGQTVRGIQYEDDFSYRRNGRLVVEDVKGVKTAVFRLKEKLFKQRYPQVLFRVVEAKRWQQPIAN